MQTTPDLIFLLGLAFLLAHELDAVWRGEWRFFFAPFSLSDESGYRLFTALHIPLFVLIFWFLDRDWFQTGFSVFLLVHALVHTLLRKHPLLKFNDNFSRLWIYGGAVFGLIFLLVG